MPKTFRRKGKKNSSSLKRKTKKSSKKMKGGNITILTFLAIFLIVTSLVAVIKNDIKTVPQGPLPTHLMIHQTGEIYVSQELRKNIEDYVKDMEKNPFTFEGVFPTTNMMKLTINGRNLNCDEVMILNKEINQFSLPFESLNKLNKEFENMTCEIKIEDVDG
jgi:hypothetical protein